MGFSILIAILYCLGDIDAALTTPTGYPFIEIFTQASRSVAGGTALSAFLVLMFTFATLSVLTTSSRQLWAFARDAAVPNAKVIAYVYPSMKVPVVSIAVTASVTCLLSLINVGSSAPTSYLIPFSLFLHTRLNHPSSLTRGPWHLGRSGPWINAFAILWTVVMMFFSFWPASVPVTPISMNWSCVLWSGVVLFAVGFWWVHGSKVYKGPVIETTVEERRAA
jgi:choline transport protein